MPTTVEISTTLVPITCHVSYCGILFAVPERWNRSKLQDHSTFYCPNGHAAMYAGKTEEEKLREQLTRTEAVLSRERDLGKRLADDNMNLANSRRALRGVVTRLRNKAAAGRCAFCDHEFPDVAAHVAAEHPGVVTDATPADEAEPTDGD